MMASPGLADGGDNRPDSSQRPAPAFDVSVRVGRTGTFHSDRAAWIIPALNGDPL